MDSLGTLKILGKGQTEVVFVNECVNTDLLRILEETTHARMHDPLLMCGLDTNNGAYQELEKGYEAIEVDVDVEHTPELVIKFVDGEVSAKSYAVKVMLVFEEDNVLTYEQKANEQEKQIEAINKIV